MNALDQLNASFELLQSDIEAAHSNLKELTLLKKSHLRKYGFGDSDIAQINETWLAGASYPRYQLSDVQNYLNTRKTNHQ